MRLSIHLLIALSAVLAACQPSKPAPKPAALTPPMQGFADDAAMSAFFTKREAYRRTHAVADAGDLASGAVPPPPAVSAPSAEPTIARAAPALGITNTQEAGVDEGGIVKVHGRHLVVLRRGRLFTVEIGAPTMRAVDRIDVNPPGTRGDGDWYDEMLIAGDRVVVIGYSYARGGTEINRFRIDDAGRLAFEDSHHLRSNDYYSSSNYASRLVGNRLIFYTPLMVGGARGAPELPGLSRWTGRGATPFARIAPAARIYVPAPIRNDPAADTSVLHTVTSCDLAAERLACGATAVLGSWSSEFYVSSRAVYVWIASAFRDRRGATRALVYRLPLDGGRPGAAQAAGGPVDQFSFREEVPEAALDVLVRAGGEGGRMWRSEVTEGEPALLHLPLPLFGDGSGVAPAAAYRPLPMAKAPDWSFHNRFVGRHLLYAAGEFAGERGGQTLFVVPLGGAPVAKVAVPHGIDRIEAMGDDAVVVGNDRQGRLGFTAIRLRTDGAALENSFFLAAASEGERRSQAFFYRPDSGSADGASGTLGLPVTRDRRDLRTARFLGTGSAIAFLRRDDRRLSAAGTLDARAEGAHDDDCRVSCTDWYGNARPIFLGGRIFALMGYEVVEGRLAGGRITEAGRLDYGSRARR